MSLSCVSLSLFLCLHFTSLHFVFMWNRPSVILHFTFTVFLIAGSGPPSWYPWPLQAPGPSPRPSFLHHYKDAVVLVSGPVLRLALPLQCSRWQRVISRTRRACPSSSCFFWPMFHSEECCNRLIRFEGRRRGNSIAAVILSPQTQITLVKDDWLNRFYHHFHSKESGQVLQ